MTAWLLTAALAQDLGSWSKPEADALDTVLSADGPRISCCGYDRASWRAMITPEHAALRACIPEVVPTRVSLKITLAFAADTAAPTATVRTEDATLEACLVGVLERMRWPGEPLGCAFQLTWPLVVLPPTEGPSD